MKLPLQLAKYFVRALLIATKASGFRQLPESRGVWGPRAFELL